MADCLLGIVVVACSPKLVQARTLQNNINHKFPVFVVMIVARKCGGTVGIIRLKTRQRFAVKIDIGVTNIMQIKHSGGLARRANLTHCHRRMI